MSSCEAWHNSCTASLTLVIDRRRRCLAHAACIASQSVCIEDIGECGACIVSVSQSSLAKRAWHWSLENVEHTDRLFARSTQKKRSAKFICGNLMRKKYSENAPRKLRMKNADEPLKQTPGSSLHHHFSHNHQRYDQMK